MWTPIDVVTEEHEVVRLWALKFELADEIVDLTMDIPQDSCREGDPYHIWLCLED